MEILSKTTVYDGYDSKTVCSATFTDVTVTPSGRILVSFRGGPTKTPYNTGENGYTCTSDDGGITFAPPKAPFGTILIDGKIPGHVRSYQLLALGGKRIFGVASVVENMEDDDSLPYFNEETEAIKNTQLFAFFSEDEGKTFTEPVQIPMKAQYADMACVTTGPPVLMKDGVILVNFEVYKKYYDTRDIHHSAACILSSDGGKTWDTEVTMYQDPEIYAWDHRAGLLADGTLVDFVWTFDRRVNDYLNIHRLESADSKVWKGFEDIGLPGQAGNPVTISDGRLAMVYFDRTGVPTLKLALSADGGHTFEEPLVVYEHKAPKAENAKARYAEAWDEMGKYTAGHCFAEALPGNQMLIVFYQGPVKDKTNAMMYRIQL